MRNIDFDGSWQNYSMKNGKFSVGFNMPEAIEGDGQYGLPPYAKRMSYLVDEYPSCPDNWMRSEGRVKSFFVPVKEGNGMWLDLNDNTYLDRHVAVVISIQGINPITGLPCKDAQLEQYIDTCPKHKKKFGADRYCKECGFKWQKQNYLATTGTPDGLFWLDGFKAADGIVRQYILTAEKMRGVASNIIGEDRVYAIGLSFFLAKEKKPESKVDTITFGSSNGYLSATYTPINNIFGCWDDNTSGDFNDNSTHTYCSNVTLDGLNNQIKSCSSVNNAEIGKVKAKLATNKNDPNLKIKTRHAFKCKKLEVGAGAKINQFVYDDPESLDFWNDEPESIICINYCIEAEAKKIISAGREEIKEHSEGFLQDIPVGN